MHEGGLFMEGMGGGGLMILYVLFFGVLFFFLTRGQRKEKARIRAMIAEIAVGDVVVTTSGFYGIVIDVTDEDVIVEFGNNKNCRIPMQKAAIAQIEKQSTSE